MGAGIIVCGLNGSGKSTLGKALAERLQYHFIDNEDLYFPKTDPDYIYSLERSEKEVEIRLLSEISEHGDFVFAATRLAFASVKPFLGIAVVMSAPRDIRLERIKARSYAKFGERMKPGGDLYDRERGFLELVSSRTDKHVEDWLKDFKGKVIRVDGTKAVDENINFILESAVGTL